MEKLDKYKIDLKSMLADRQNLDYQIGDAFFATLQAQDIQHGNLLCSLDIKRNSGGFLLQFHTQGEVSVACDRCLEDMQLPIDTTNTLTVKFGPETSDEGDDLIVVSENEGILDISWYMYEFIALSLPMQHAHEEGECNEAMLQELDKHVVSEMEPTEGSSDEETDPRWNELKKIIDK